jgi:ABC-type lipoprotein export system ATPase subunit
MTRQQVRSTSVEGLVGVDHEDGPTDSALVSCDQVGRTYGSGPSAVVAVHGVSCTVLGMDRVALVGPSGSGKSTLLHLMAGLEPASAGTIRWPALDGNPSGRPGLVGMVFQGPSLLPALDVVENVALPLVLAGFHDAEARDRAESALRRLDLAGLGSKWPEELSGGQAQRVAVARVLAGSPALILADEPTGQLDGTTGAHVLDVLLQAATELGAAVVISTHDPAVAGRLDTIWRMRDGSIKPSGAAGGAA